MQLAALVADARTLAPEARAVVERLDAGGRDVTSVIHDSRAAGPGALFVAVRGQRADGAEFAAQAAARGAVAIVAETPAPAGIDIPWLVTGDARLALAELASLAYARPSEDLQLVGVTGTNGKTTCTYLLAAIFDAADLACGRMGTVSVKVAGHERDASHTTPEASEVQRLLREMASSPRASTGSNSSFAAKSSSMCSASKTLAR